MRFGIEELLPYRQFIRQYSENSQVLEKSTKKRALFLLDCSECKKVASLKNASKESGFLATYAVKEPV